MTSAPASNYRPDIDGLRALAVGVVFLFHLGLSWLPGGYLGVDVFYVISGYVITRIIVADQQANRFSFADFYQRRIRRIVPSLLVTLVLSATAAALLFTIPDLIAFARSLTYSLFFAANHFFAGEAHDYFSDNSTMPLLHLWSIAVEMQFYLVWPFLLVWLLCRVAPARMPRLIIALCALSFLLAVLLWQWDDTLAFYLMPARFYEFLLGAALVWLPASPRLTPRRAGILYAIAFVVLLIAFVSFAAGSLPATLAQLIACLAATALIAVASHTRLSRVLSNRVAAYLGRISYEIYLLHWPVIIFALYLPLPPGTIPSALLVPVVLLLSAACYHAIGHPLRTRFHTTLAARQNVMIGELLVAVAILFVALSIVRSGGWYWRLSEEALLLMRNPTKFHETQYGGAGYRENTMITLGDATKPPQFLIFGDSFAAQYAAGLDSFLKSHGRSAQLYFLNGCLIMPHVTGHAPGNVNPACNEAFYTVRQLVREKQLPVIHAQSWGSFKDHSSVRDGDAITFPKERNDEYYTFIVNAIHASRQAFGTPFAFTGISPGLNETNVSRCSEMPAWLSGYCQSDVSVPEGERLNGQEFNTAAQAYVTANPGALFLNPRSALCQNGFCYAMRGSQAYYSDYAHFTKAGALLVLNYYATPLLSFGAQ